MREHVNPHRPVHGRGPMPPLHPREDVSALVHAAKAGDERSWPVMVDRYDATIRAIARRHSLCAADQDEVAQQTWVQLLLHIDDVKTPAALGGWLKTTARRESLRILEAARREIPIAEPISPEEPDVTSAEDHLVAAERARRAARCSGPRPGPPASRPAADARQARPQLRRRQCEARYREGQHRADAPSPHRSPAR
jgi:hypothetical protein